MIRAGYASLDVAALAGSPATEILPVAFGPHRGALHRPAGGRARALAVVICPPVGREARCAYRPLFLWADALAQRGFSVLRYDHHGEGDSAELDPEVDQWPHWLAGLGEAAEFVRAETQAGAVAIAGLRIGATLAAEAAQAIAPEALIMLAPLQSGEAWIRELQWTAAMQRAAAPVDGGIEVDGLRISPATLETLRGVDLARVQPAWRAAYLAGPSSLTKPLSRKLGASLEAVPFPGYGKLFKDAHVNEPPTEAFAAAADWLERSPAAQAWIEKPADPPGNRFVAPDWIEEGVSFGDGLRGVICLPRRRSTRQAVLFANTASDPRAGVGGFAAYAGRALAAGGVATLRFDFRGVGESAADSADWRTHVYLTPRLEDYRLASAVLRRHGYDDIVLVGVCTGGFHAVHAVLAGAEFRRAVAVNSWFVWRVPASLELRAEVANDTGRKVRVLGREIDVTRLQERAALHLRNFWEFLRPDAACRAVRAQIRAASRQGARIQFVFGPGDKAMDGLERDFGPQGVWLKRQAGMSVSLLEGLDHALFSRASQTVALEAIRAFVAEGRAGETPNALSSRPGDALFPRSAAPPGAV